MKKFMLIYSDGQLIQLPANLSSNIITMTVNNSTRMRHEQIVCALIFILLDITRQSTAIYDWTLNHADSTMCQMTNSYVSVALVFVFLLVHISHHRSRIDNIKQKKNDDIKTFRLERDRSCIECKLDVTNQCFCRLFCQHRYLMTIETSIRCDDLFSIVSCAIKFNDCLS
jgi:hypothetical protein